MKTLKIAIAVLALTPSLAFARPWGRDRDWDRRDYRPSYGYFHSHYYQRPRVVYYEPAPRCEAPRPVAYIQPQPVPAPVVLGVAAGLTTALIVASLAHGR